MRALRELLRAAEVVVHVPDVLLVLARHDAQRLARIHVREIADAHRRARGRGHDRVAQLVERAIARADRLHGDRQLVAADLEQQLPHRSAHFARDGGREVLRVTP